MYLIPKPQRWELGEGAYRICYDGTIVIDRSCGAGAFTWAQMLQKEFETFAGFAPDIMRGRSKRAAVTLAVRKNDDGCEGGGVQEKGCAAGRIDGVQRQAAGDDVGCACGRAEAYRLSIGEDGVSVVGETEAGLFCGIQTLRQVVRQGGAALPFMEIWDYPDIANRGYYLDVTRCRIPTLAYLKETVDRLAFYKINQFQLYIEHTYLFEDLSEVWRDDTPLTAEDILELDAYCRARCIDLVPSVASFGHLYKVLRTRTYRHLGELPEQADLPFSFVDRMAHHTLDVTNEESMRFAKKLISEYMELFTSKYFNVCADETFDLGKGRSREYAKQYGTERIYIDFVKELCEFVVEKGRTPMFWGDIICGFPDAVRELPPETICLNWGYAPDQSDESTRKLAKAGAVQYCCPAVVGWSMLANRLHDAYENIRRMCTYANQYGAVGVLTTDWGDYGHISHPDFSVPGMIYGAAFSWNREIPQFDEINEQISHLEYLDRSGSLVSAAAELAEHWAFTWNDLVNYKEYGQIESGPEQLAKAGEETAALEAQRDKLYELLPSVDTRTRRYVAPYLIAIDGMQLIQTAGLIITGQGSGTQSVTKNNDPAAPASRQEEGSLTAPASYQENVPAKSVAYQEESDPAALASRLEEWFYQYKRLWRTVSREGELARVQDVINWTADRLRMIER